MKKTSDPSTAPDGVAKDTPQERGHIFNRDNELVSSFTHFAGMLLSIAGLVLLVVYAVRYATPWHVVTFSVYGASMILLYLASSVYHLLYISDKVRGILRQIDHMAIFVLIAGTYTPICLVPLRGGWGWALFGCIWACAVAGILVKVFWMNAPRWLYTLFYILMGWMALVALYPLIQRMPTSTLCWLFGGGLAYTIGGVQYALKWPRLKNKYFGFHEIFHIFILLGSVCHFIMMWQILYL